MDEFGEGMPLGTRRDEAGIGSPTLAVEASDCCKAKLWATQAGLMSPTVRAASQDWAVGTRVRRAHRAEARG